MSTDPTLARVRLGDGASLAYDSVADTLRVDDGAGGDIDMALTGSLTLGDAPVLSEAVFDQAITVPGDWSFTGSLSAASLTADSLGVSGPLEQDGEAVATQQWVLDNTITGGDGSILDVLDDGATLLENVTALDLGSGVGGTVDTATNTVTLNIDSSSVDAASLGGLTRDEFAYQQRTFLVNTSTTTTEFHKLGVLGQGTAKARIRADFTTPINHSTPLGWEAYADVNNTTADMEWWRWGSTTDARLYPVLTQDANGDVHLYVAAPSHVRSRVEVTWPSNYVQSVAYAGPMVEADITGSIVFDGRTTGPNLPSEHGALTSEGSVVLTEADTDAFAEPTSAETITAPWDFTGGLTENGSSVLTTADEGTLNAGTLDGVDSAAFGEVGAAETVTGAWDFTGGLTANGNSVLTSADEGTLDAGSVDGLDSGQFLRSDTTLALGTQHVTGGVHAPPSWDTGGGLGLQDDALAHADRYYTVTFPGGTAKPGEVANIFDSEWNNVAHWEATDTFPVSIEIDLGGTTHYWQAFGVSFGLNRQAASVTLEAFDSNTSAWVTLKDVTDNTGFVVGWSGKQSNVSRLRVTFADGVHSSGDINIARIWGYCADDDRLAGRGHWLSKSGGDIVGDVSLAGDLTGSGRRGTTVYYDPANPGPYADGTAAKNDVPEGGTLQLAAGDYDVATQGRLNLTRGITIQGEGWAEDSNGASTPVSAGTRLINTGADTIDQPVIDFINTTEYQHGGVVRNLAIQHEGATSAALRYRNFTRSVTERVYIDCNGVGARGIEYADSTFFARCLRSRVVGFTGTGVLAAGTGYAHEFHQNHIATSADGAIALDNQTNRALISGGEYASTGVGGTAIRCYRSGGMHGGIIIEPGIELTDYPIKLGTDGSGTIEGVQLYHTTIPLADTVAGVTFDNAENCRLIRPIAQSATTTTKVPLAHWTTNAVNCGVLTDAPTLAVSTHTDDGATAPWIRCEGSARSTDLAQADTGVPIWADWSPDRASPVVYDGTTWHDFASAKTSFTP